LRAEFEAKLLTELGMTRADFALFIAIHYGITVSPSRLPEIAMGEHNTSNLASRDW
jgi:hypothetical protein